MVFGVSLRKIFYLIILLLSPVYMLNAQRSKVLVAYQLIENEKYTEAKTDIEEAIQDDKTKDWAKTWYTRGLLCQTAYEKGKKTNDKKMMELYPDQLFVAYNSYSHCMYLDKNGKMNNQIAPLLVQLANYFLSLGQENYNKKDYAMSLKAYEYALMINNSEILDLTKDTSLLYNTAITAYKNRSWDKAVKYLDQLNDLKYSSNVSHLLFTAYLVEGDTVAAKQALENGVKQYSYNDTLVLLLTDFLFQNGETTNAMILLDSAETRKSGNPIFPFTKGLIYQKTEQYDEAVKSYETSLAIDPERIETYTNIANCYYNMAVDIDEKARKINNIRLFQDEKARAIAARDSAVTWLEKAYEKDPLNQQVRDQLNQLYQFLHKD